MQRRTWRVLLLVGLLLGAGGILAINNFQSNEAVNVSNGVTVSPEYSDFELTIEGDTEMALSNAFPEPHTVDVNVSEGNISLAARNGTAATIHSDTIEGPWTNVTDITAGGTWIEIYPYDKQRVDVRGDTNVLNFTAMQVDDGNTDFYISGPNGGTGTVRIYDLPANEQIAAVDATTDEFLGAATTDGSGTGTFNIDLSAHSVELMTVDAVAPEVDNTGPDDTVVDGQTTVTADVSDGDFPADEVTVDLVIDNHRTTDTVVDSTTIQQNGTASLSYTFENATETEYYFEATDAYGNTVTSSTRTVYSPGYLELTSETVSINQIDFSSPGSVSFNIDRYNSGWLNISNATAGGDWIEIDRDSGRRVDLRGDITDANLSADITLDDGATDFRVNGTGSGTASVKVYGLPANTQLRAIDTGQSELLDVVTTDGSGVATFDIGLSSHTVQLTTTADTDAPTQNNASPDGPQMTPPSDISVDIDDADLPYDEIDVTISLDGNQIHTETIQNAQTITTPIPQSGQTGGQHSYTVVAEDAYGNTNTEVYDYSVPDTLFVRNATNHTQLVPANGEITFFGENAVYTRTTDDGTLNLTGLPVNQEFLVRVEPTDSNYTTRIYYFESIYVQQSAYLLNTSAYSTIESRFVLNDPTGEFGSESVLSIQRPIVINGTQTWQTVYADEFGSEGITAVLQEDERYRLKISNDQTEQLIGPYRADVGETVQVEPGDPTVTLPNFTDGWAANASIVDGNLQWRYSDPSGETDRLDVTIYEKNNESNVLFDDEYFNIGNASAAPNLTANQSELTWVVEFEVNRDGEEFTERIEVGAPNEQAGQLGGNWQTIAGVLLLFLLAAAFSQLNAAVGAVVVSLFGGLLWFIGLLGGATTGGAVVVALFISITNHVRTSGGP
jgi:hypothetical protein